MNRAATIEDGRADAVRRTLHGYLIGLAGVSLALAVLHLLFAEFEAGNVFWFNLDKERNLATWFSGSLFFLFGASALVAFGWEIKRNAERATFRLPVLWLGVAVVGFYMSLDEITILHENLFWKEVRQASNERSDTWKYLTQWQLLFAPAILAAAGYMTVFFANRFGASRRARGAAWAGLGCWFAALFLEGVRGMFRRGGGDWYGWQVVIEEQLEILGAIFLVGAIASYVVDIALDLTERRRGELTRADRWLNRTALVGLSAVCGVMLLSAGVVYHFAREQAAAGDPVPGLFRRAVGAGSQPATGGVRVGTLPELPDTSNPAIWFEDVASNPELPAGIAGDLDGLTAALMQPDAPASPLLAADRAPRMVFVSLGDAASRVRVFTGLGAGLTEAIRDAARTAGLPATAEGRWVRLDIVDHVDDTDRFDFRPPLAMDPGLHGLAFERRSGISVLPAEVLANKIVNKDREIAPRALLDYLEAKNPVLARRFTAMVQPGVANPYRFFRTLGYTLEGRRLRPLYRGHRLFSEEQLTPDALVRSAQEGTDYLVRVTDAAGRFVYSQDPSDRSMFDAYNMLRHAGTIYSMVEMYQVNGDAKLLAAIERAIDFLLANIKPCPNFATRQCAVDIDSVKLGGNALAAIALAQYEAATGNTEYRERAASLVGWIQDVQDEAGQFTVHKESFPRGVASSFVSEYYPGEAVLALVRVFERTGDSSLLDTAERASRWLIQVRDGGKGVDQLSHDHWLLYGLDALHRHRPDPLYVTHAGKIVQAIVDAQNTEPEWIDWLGSYYRPPRTTPTAIRTEGLAAAWSMMGRVGDRKTMTRIEAAVRLGIRFQLQTQASPELNMFLAEPAPTLGGFRRGLDEYEIRIDYVQHNISALLAAAKMLESPASTP